MADKILVLAEKDGETLRDTTFEALGLAHRLGKEAGHEVGSLLLGAGLATVAGTLAERGGGEVLRVDGEPLREYTQDGYGRALEALLAEEKPWMVLATHGPTGWDIMPRLAAALDAPLVTEVTGVAMEGGAPVFTRRAFNGKFEARVGAGDAPPFLATLQKGAHAPVEAAPAGSVRSIPCSVDGETLRTRFVEVRAGEEGAVDLSQAEIIVSGGRGLKEADNFAILRELADATTLQSCASLPTRWADRSGRPAR